MLRTDRFYKQEDIEFLPIFTYQEQLDDQRSIKDLKIVIDEQFQTKICAESQNYIKTEATLLIFN